MLKVRERNKSHFELTKCASDNSCDRRLWECNVGPGTRNGKVKNNHQNNISAKTELLGTARMLKQVLEYQMRKSILKHHLLLLFLSNKPE